MGWKDLLDGRRFTYLVAAIWLVSAVFIAFLMHQLDWIVHHDLYTYGLQFSLNWASPYWAFLWAIYGCLALSSTLSLIVLCTGFLKHKHAKNAALNKNVVYKGERKSAVNEAEPLNGNHMLITCPNCKRVFSKPLVMLDFSKKRSRLVNSCPYCNQVLDQEEEENQENVGIISPDKKEVKH